eukprot:1711934-Prymnesium_polylepis.1
MVALELALPALPALPALVRACPALRTVRLRLSPLQVDDVGALCLAHALADRSEVELIATVHDAGTPHGVGA